MELRSIELYELIILIAYFSLIDSFIGDYSCSEGFYSTGAKELIYFDFICCGVSLYGSKISISLFGVYYSIYFKHFGSSFWKGVF
jgi:hypothetical protein